MKQFLPVIVTFFILVGGALFFLVSNNDDGFTQTDEQRLNSVTRQVEESVGDTRLLIGESDAPATVVEYFDYKCPACNNFHRTTSKEIEAAYVDTGQAKYDVRITPVIGPDSAHAARGAYCANEQNVFSDYHNAVLDHMWDNYYSQGSFAVEFENYLTTSKLAEILTNAGVSIDLEAHATCTDSDKYNPFLDQNLQQAANDGIQGTPGFAVGEQSFVGGQPFNVFQTLIDIQLR